MFNNYFNHIGFIIRKIFKVAKQKIKSIAQRLNIWYGDRPVQGARFAIRAPSERKTTTGGCKP